VTTLSKALVNSNIVKIRQHESSSTIPDDSLGWLILLSFYVQMYVNAWCQYRQKYRQHNAKPNSKPKPLLL